MPLCICLPWSLSVPILNLIKTGRDLIASNLTLTLPKMLIGNVQGNVVVAARPPRRSFCQTMANNKLLYRRRRDDAFYVAMRLE